MRYVAKRQHWVLYWRDRNEDWHKYDLVEPSPDVLALLDEIDRDRTRRCSWSCAGAGG